MHTIHFQPVKEVVWHCKGDYLATVVVEGESIFLSLNLLHLSGPSESSTGVLIHQVSKRRSQVRGKWQRVRERQIFFLVSAEAIPEYKGSSSESQVPSHQTTLLCGSKPNLSLPPGPAPLLTDTDNGEGV